jgi:hypothetical protein
MTPPVEANAGGMPPAGDVGVAAVRLPAFVLATLAWLVPAFTVWYFAAPVIVAPAVLLARLVAGLGLPDIVQSIEQAGSTATFVTTLRAASAGARGVVTVDVNTLLYSFGRPLFAALTLAARESAWKRHLVLGYVAMLPFVAWGIVAEFLKNVAITSGPAIASQAGFGPWQREAIAFAYQFGALILPAVVPAVLWVALHGAFIARLRGHESRTSTTSGSAL